MGAAEKAAAQVEQLQQALHAARAEAAGLRARLHASGPRTAAQAQARLRAEQHAREAARLMNLLRQRALLHAVRICNHLPGRGRLSAGRAFERWRGMRAWGLAWNCVEQT